MDYIHDFDSDIAYVLEECEKRILEYPSGIKQFAYKYLDKLHLLKDKNQSGGFCYLMPFWLMDTFGIERRICRNIAIGNSFALLYFMSQDEVMDDCTQKSKVELLPVSSLFFTEFISSYQSTFPGESSFWQYFDKYMKEWAGSVVWERSNHWGQANEYTEEDLILLSRKAAPMKIPFAAMSILSGNELAVKAFSDMVDYDQIVYQMIDDWRDWKEDMEIGNYTYLLVQAVKYNNLKEASQLNESLVRKAVYIGGIAEEIFELAKKYNKLSLECISNIDSPYLRDYISLEEIICDKILTNIREEKGIMMKGGLDSLLWSIKRS
ncbi:MAG: hypothetical protein N3I35_01220 [Clostridia bacterium]|nr:hypothetical protein [Clostridia bacterium]